MGLKTRDLIFVLFGLVLAGCAGFAFKYYGLEGVSYQEGKLLGPRPELDKPFSACEPTQATKHPCVVMFAPEFKALRTDYGNCKINLEECERQLGQCR